jgi:4a-hydroxytetrahydrobiopterin dehydratase
MELDLETRGCEPFHKGGLPLDRESVTGYLSQLPGWKRSGKGIARTYGFKDFYETMGFVNAVAYIANEEGHHPDLEVGHQTCRVRYYTREPWGLTENDFICAEKIDRLLRVTQTGYWPKN